MRVKLVATSNRSLQKMVDRVLISLDSDWPPVAGDPFARSDSWLLYDQWAKSVYVCGSKAPSLTAQPYSVTQPALEECSWVKDGLWSLISRAPSPRGLSACVTRSPAQMHTGAAAAASWGSFPASGVHLSHRVTPGYLAFLFFWEIEMYLAFLKKLFSYFLSSCQFWYNVKTANNPIPLPPSSHVCQHEEAQCGFKGRTSMSCLTLFTINPVCFPLFSLHSEERVQEEEI